MPTTTEDIRDFIHAKFPHVTIADEEDIFGLGFVNSLFAMELVMFLEGHFGFRIGNEDLELSNFRTVVAMERLVVRNVPAAA
ncbi:MAG TPA: acyl carrier protein [Solirubrobacteraceae bacterium]|nr:acyl carrier protein [Solirubrobacteraceae bacterium]